MKRTTESGGHSAALPQLALLFLTLGTIAFGGPAAHIAMMRDEVVRRRGWLTDQEFLDLVGATNLIPGPNSTEMAIHVGYRMAGWRGLLVAGACFILPAMLIVLGLAWTYVRYGATPQGTWLLYGIKPVIIAVVVQALWNLGRTAVKGVFLGAVGLAVLSLFFLGVNEIALLLVGGVFVMLALNARRAASAGAVGGLTWHLMVGTAAAVQGPPTVTHGGPVSVVRILLIFLKIGSVLYGSGYVLLAFLRSDFVERLRWLTDKQLLDAVAVGQVTPGPVFTTATFIGYVLGGFPAAVLATIGIFLPAFVFVAASHPFIPRLRRSPWTAALLDGVNVAALALMAGVTWYLLRAAVIDGVTLVLVVVSSVLLLRFRVNSVWLVLGGAAIGLAVGALRR